MAMLGEPRDMPILDKNANNSAHDHMLLAHQRMVMRYLYRRSAMTSDSVNLANFARSSEK